MSVNSRMKNVKVFELNEKETPSGAKKQKWIEKEDTILMAIYQVDQFVSHENFRNTETTHQALSYDKSLIARKTRIKAGDKKYNVLDIDNNHRLAVLSLKEVDIW
ncbi:hypothetical protein ACKA04_02390 [Helcococcus kunzii]|uniref:hypothetical protein n=1 Tax=Helcococcus kunzii TaxID=40091 RepID=UPI0038A0ABEC